MFTVPIFSSNLPKDLQQNRRNSCLVVSCKARRSSFCDFVFSQALKISRTISEPNYKAKKGLVPKSLHVQIHVDRKTAVHNKQAKTLDATLLNLSDAWAHWSLLLYPPNNPWLMAIQTNLRKSSCKWLSPGVFGSIWNTFVTAITQLPFWGIAQISIPRNSWWHSARCQISLFHGRV